jgi:hypothetical protein
MTDGDSVMETRTRGGASPELLRALVEVIAAGSSLAKLYAGLLAEALVEGNATGHCLWEKMLREQRERSTDEEDWDPPRPTLSQLRREAGRR